MIECKKLRISEIRRGVFIIERYNFGNPGKWVELNKKGEEKQDVFTGNGLIAIRDESEYKYLKEAEEAMQDFLTYPRVVKEIDSEAKAVRVSQLEPLSKLKINRISHDAVEKVPKDVLDAVFYLSRCQKIEELYADAYEIEKAMNEVARELKWEPFKITIEHVNKNVNNPI